MRDTRAIRLCTKPVAETDRTLSIIAAIVSVAMSSHSSSTPTSSAEDQRSSDAPVEAGYATLPNRLLGFQVARPAGLLLALFIGAAQPTFARSDDAAVPLRTSPVDNVPTALQDQPDDATADQLAWPHEIIVPGARIVMYQPQLETFSGNILTARAAVSVTPTEAEEPIFGAVCFQARVETDRDQRTISLLDMDVSNAKFPSADPAKVQTLSEVLTEVIMRWNPAISLDRVLMALELAEMNRG